MPEEQKPHKNIPPQETDAVLPIIGPEETSDLRIHTDSRGHVLHHRPQEGPHAVRRVGAAPGEQHDPEETTVLGPAEVAELRNSLQKTGEIPVVEPTKTVREDELDLLLRGPRDQSLTEAPTGERLAAIKSQLEQSRDRIKPPGIVRRVGRNIKNMFSRFSKNK
jgi:hypothetical protein